MRQVLASALWGIALTMVGVGPVLGEPTDAQTAGEADSAKAEKAKKPKLEVQASLHSRLTVTDEEEEPAAEFGLERARIEVTWNPAKGISAVIEGALEQVVQGADAQRIVKDAYLEMKIRKWLQLKVGQFKKPVSALELTSKGKLALVERGEGNRYLIRSLEYGSRDLGLEFFGRISKQHKVEYYVGVFNGAKLPSEEGDPNGAKDVVARLEGELFEGLRLGVSGVWKGIDQGGADAEDKPSYGYLASVDLRYKTEALWVLAEGNWARNHLVEDAPSAAGAVLAVAYKFPAAWIGEGGALEPALRGEWMRPDMDADGQMWAVSGGVNVWLAPWVRLMLQGEWVRPDDELSHEWPEVMRGWLQVAFDY